MDRRWTAARWGGRGGHSELSQQVGQDGQGGPSGITCPVACQSRVAPRPKSGFQAQCGGGLENPWVGTERCVPLNASAGRLHLALELRRVHCFHPTLSARYRPGSSRGSARPPATAPRMDQDRSSKSSVGSSFLPEKTNRNRISPLRWTVLACCLPYPGDPKSAIDCFFLFGISLHPGVTGSAHIGSFEAAEFTHSQVHRNCYGPRAG